jgi:hypothetical protein
MIYFRDRLKYRTGGRVGAGGLVLLGGHEETGRVAGWTCDPNRVLRRNAVGSTQNHIGERNMPLCHQRSLRALLLAGAAVLAAAPTFAAEVTPDRLVNADKEPGNWLMNHRTYDAQRFSPLDRIKKANVKGLKLAYAVAIGGTVRTKISRQPRLPRTASFT